MVGEIPGVGEDGTLRQGGGLEWVEGPALGDSIANARWGLPAGPCLGIDTVNANWANLDPPKANLQARVFETCGQRHPGGKLYGLLRAMRRDGSAKEFNFTIEFGALNARESRIVGATVTLYIGDPPPDEFELIVSGECARAGGISGRWSPCNVA